MAPSKAVLIIDADSALNRALCDELRDGGYHVIAHTREATELPFPKDVTHVICTHASNQIAAWSDTWGPLSHVVFGQRNQQEMDCNLEEEVEVLITSLETQLSDFLMELQSAVQLLARHSGGQIWVITQEDSMHYYMPMLTAPIVTRARHAAVKSFAKEVFRLGVFINCATVQLLAEQADPIAWRDARDGLKAFAMKFKPVKAAAVARTLGNWLAQDELPMVGLVVPLGIGFSENNI